MDGLLDHPAQHVGNPQRAGAAVALGDVHRPNRSGLWLAARSAVATRIPPGRSRSASLGIDRRCQSHAVSDGYSPHLPQSVGGSPSTGSSALRYGYCHFFRSSLFIRLVHAHAGHTSDDLIVVSSSRRPKRGTVRSLLLRRGKPDNEATSSLARRPNHLL